MDRREPVFRDNTLRYQYRVLEVVAVPGHKRDQQILPESQFAHIGGRAIGKHIAVCDLVSRLDERALIDARVLVRTRVLGQVVNVHARLGCAGLIVVNAHDDA